MKPLLNQKHSMQKHLIRGLMCLAAMILTCALWTTPAHATGVYQMPSIAAGDNTWVVDEAEVLSRLNEGKLSSTLEDLAKKTGYEVRFVTIRRLDYGETPESFTKALFKKWFPTPETQAKQAILMIDSVTNGTSMVTGDEVKSVMSDTIAESVASETIMTPLRDGNKYNQAFLDASDRIALVLSGQPDPGPPQIAEKVEVASTFKSAAETKKEKSNSTAWVIGLLVAATVIPMATYYIYQVFAPNSQ